MSPLRIIFAGSGEFGLPALRMLVEARHNVVAVFSQPDRPAGRGRHLTPTPIAQFALEKSLPLLRTDNINATPLPPADILIVIAFGQKISEALCRAPRLGAINLHASLLPKYRGAAPINWAIIKGETITGNSIIRLASRMDAGPILAQSRIQIGDLETAGELHDRLAADGASLLLRSLNALASGTLTEAPQDDSLATLAPKLTRQQASLDFTRPAEELARRIRGLYPWPGCAVELQDDDGKVLAQVTLVRARPQANAGVQPGQTIDTGIGAGESTALEILDIKPPGKSPMSFAAYRNGHPWIGPRAVSSI